MITKEQVEKILVQNGVEPTADDEVIKSALLRANWHDDDVDAALIVLKENVVTHESHVDAVQNLFRGRAKLTPSDINNLLGIEVDITPADIRTSRVKGKLSTDYSQIVEIAVVSLVLSVIFLVGGMWIFEVGLFHQTMMKV